MKRMKPWQSRLAAAVVLIVALVAWRVLAEQDRRARRAAFGGSGDPGPGREASVSDTVSAYGVIAGSPAASRTWPPRGP